MNVLDQIPDAKKVSTHKGGEYHSPCPGCGGNDRFHIWPEQHNGQGSYWCRGCGKSGDLIQFLRDFRGLSFQDACKAAGKDIPVKPRMQRPGLNRRNKAATWSPESREMPPVAWQQKAEAFTAWAHDRLLANQAELDYLAGRGITLEAVRRFRLGWNPGDLGKDLFRHRKAWGLPEVLKPNGKPKMLWLPVGLVIPYTRHNCVVRLRIRRPAGRQPETPRYYVIPGSFMGAMLIHPDRPAQVVMEAELDAILVAEAQSVAGAVALGSSSARPDRQAHEVLIRALCVLNALDADTAGATETQRFWVANYPNADRWPVPQGKDPGDAFKAGVSIPEWIRAGLPPRLLMPKASPAPAPTPKSASKADVPASVKELHILLRQYPVAISKTPRRMRLLEDETWARKHWDISSRISRLVYLDPDCFRYVSGHEAEIITGKNLLTKLGGE